MFLLSLSPVFSTQRKHDLFPLKSIFKINKMRFLPHNMPSFVGNENKEKERKINTATTTPSGRALMQEAVLGGRPRWRPHFPWDRGSAATPPSVLKCGHGGPDGEPHSQGCVSYSALLVQGRVKQGGFREFGVSAPLCPSRVLESASA